MTTIEVTGWFREGESGAKWATKTYDNVTSWSRNGVWLEINQDATTTLLELDNSSVESVVIRKERL